MEQRLTFVTLGVTDLDVMKTWYKEVFGWKPFKDDQGICFFRLNGFVLGLYPSNELAEDIGIGQDGAGFKRFALAINFRSEEEVDRVTDSLRSGGVRVVRTPERVFWGGYRGYIADPEDNYWELAYNPFIRVDERGNLVIEDPEKR